MSKLIRCDICGLELTKCKYKIELYKREWSGDKLEYEKDVCLNCYGGIINSFKEY